ARRRGHDRLGRPGAGDRLAVPPARPLRARPQRPHARPVPTELGVPLRAPRRREVTMPALSDDEWLRIRRQATAQLIRKWITEGRVASLDQLIARLHLLVDKKLLDPKDGLLTRAQLEPGITARLEQERAQVAPLLQEGFTPDEVRRLMEIARRAEDRPPD